MVNSIQRLGINLEQLQQLNKLLLLEEGKILKALVSFISENDDGKVLLNVNGLKLEAETTIPLTKGDILWLKVEKAEDQSFVLKMTDSPQAMSTKGEVDKALPLQKKDGNLREILFKVQDTQTEDLFNQLPENKKVLATVKESTVAKTIFEFKADSLTKEQVKENSAPNKLPDLKLEQGLNLKIGDKVILEVNRYDRIFKEVNLKILPQELNDKVKIVPKEVYIEKVLEKLNIKSTETNKTVVLKLMEKLLPVEPETIQNLNQDIAKLEITKDAVKIKEYIELRTWMKTTNISETRENIKTLSQFFTHANVQEPDELVAGLRLLNQSEPNQSLYQQVLNSAWFRQGNIEGEVYLFKDGKGSKQTNIPKKLLLHFVTENLGDLWINLLYTQDKVHIDIFSSKEDTKTLFADNMMLLRDVIHKQGISIETVNYHDKKIDNVFMALEASNQNPIAYGNIDFVV
jgi:bifunctional DNA-binding transcriptional regulator/antitoxin component of YhaV-PrlF toxin-antitoxin module